MKLSRSAYALLIVFAVTVVPSITRAHTINFETDTPNYFLGPFQSVQSNIVTFSNSQPYFIQIFDPPGETSETDGTSLVHYGLSDAELIMDFSVPIDYLSLEFGNDDPTGTEPGDYAILQLLSDGLKVGQSIVIMNRNDAMDQTILFSGAQFNRATFNFVASNIYLAEVVDNIEFKPSAAPVPEPATMLLLGTGLAGIGGAIRSRRQEK